MEELWVLLCANSCHKLKFLCLNGTEIQLNFLLDKCLHWKQQWWSPQTRPFNMMHIFCLFSCFIVRDVSVKMKDMEVISVVFGSIFTLCTVLDWHFIWIEIRQFFVQWKEDLRLPVSNILVSFPESTCCVYLYVKVPGSIKMLLIWYVIAFSFLMFKHLFLAKHYAINAA